MNGLWRIPAVLLFAVACSDAEAAGNRSNVVPAMVDSAAADGWVRSTPAGDVVRLTPEPGGPRVGTNRLIIAVEPDTRIPLSVDIVAPLMPMHGVVRRPVEREAGKWIARVSIPMAGEWSVYVNFDDGEDATAISFAVKEATSAGHMEHGHRSPVFRQTPRVRCRRHIRGGAHTCVEH